MNGILLGVLLAWLAVVVFSALTLQYIKKRKDCEVSSGDSKSKKEYDMVIAWQGIQIVLGTLGALLAGAKLFGHHAGNSKLGPVADYLSRY